MLQNFNISPTEKVSINKSWLDRQSLQILETLILVEWEVCHKEEGIFEILNDIYRLQYNKTKITTILQASQMT